MMLALIPCSLLAALLAGCSADDPVEAAVDRDQDGFAAGDDCDDLDGRVYPEAIEICDGQDNDCDGRIDGEGAMGMRSWLPDVDGDGFGDPSGQAVLACEAVVGRVDNGDDCDDANPHDSTDCSCSSDVDGHFVVTGGDAKIAGGVWHFGEFTVERDTVLYVIGDEPLLIVADRATIDGTIDASGADGGSSGDAAGPDGGGAVAGGGGGGGGGDCGNGAGDGGLPNGIAGISDGGPGGAARDSWAAVAYGGDFGWGTGGGGGGSSAAGADGALESGINGCGPGYCTGGAAFGDASLERQFTGGGGGAGGGANGGGGGGGGGAVAIFAAEVLVTGRIDVSGGAGGGKAAGNCTSGGGGGGAGGMIWLQAGRAEISGSLSAEGGAGGTAGLTQPGGAGADGRIRVSGSSVILVGSVSPKPHTDGAPPVCD